MIPISEELRALTVWKELRFDVVERDYCTIVPFAQQRKLPEGHETKRRGCVRPSCYAKARAKNMCRVHVPVAGQGTSNK